MSILIAEGFEIAAAGRFDLELDDERNYANPETAAAFWAWSKAREGIVVSLPEPVYASEDSPGDDIFTRSQVVEMVGAAGVTVA